MQREKTLRWVLHLCAVDALSETFLHIAVQVLGTNILLGNSNSTFVYTFVPLGLDELHQLRSRFVAIVIALPLHFCHVGFLERSFTKLILPLP